MFKSNRKIVDLLSLSILIGFSLLFLAIFVYAFYRSNFLPDNLSDRYDKYYFISILGMLFFAMLFFLNKKIQRWINFSLLSFLVCIFSLEIILDTVELPRGLHKEKILAAKNNNVEFDHRMGFSVLSDLKSKGLDIVSGIYPQAFNLTNGIPNKNIFPLSGISNKKTLHCNETGQWKYHHSDRYGFSNLNKYWDKKEIDYLILGDQFSQGACVDQDKNISSYLKEITKKNVLNLSLVGNGPLLKLATLKEYGIKVKPKRVLWFYYEGNDLVDELHREKQSQILLSYLKTNFTQNLFKRLKEIDIELIEFSKIDELLWKTKIYRLYNIRSLLSFDKEDIEYKVVIDPLYKLILSEAKKTVGSWNGKIEFIYIPQFERYKKNSEENWKKKELSELVNK